MPRDRRAEDGRALPATNDPFRASRPIDLPWRLELLHFSFHKAADDLLFTLRNPRFSKVHRKRRQPDLLGGAIAHLLPQPLFQVGHVAGAKENRNRPWPL